MERLAMRTQIAEIVRAIQPYDPLEGAHVAATIAWIDSGAPLCRVAKPATPPQHLVSYAAVVDLTSELLLLVDHRQSGLWLPSGGHVEPGEHPDATAQRELWEELHIPARFVFRRPLFLTVTQTVGATAGHTDVSLWYVLHADSRAALWYDQGEFQQIAWFSLGTMLFERTDPHMRRFVAKLRGALGLQ
jgi:8-oxo-dGTP pyrophosphatase MutT (NUDIX family)